MKNYQLIFKNISFLAFSQILSSAISFFLLIYIAQYLGEANFGKYSFALSYTALFVVIADIGIHGYTIREFARNKGETNKVITNIIFIKILTSILAFSLICLSVSIIKFEFNKILIILIFGIYIILNSFALFFKSVFQGYERMEFDALGTITYQIILFSLVLLSISLNYGLWGIGISYIIAEVVEVFLLFYLILAKISRPVFTLDLKLWKSIIIGAYPFGINAILAVIYFRIDTIMLSFLKSDTDVGIYNAAYNPLLSIGIISTVFISAIYPAMSREYLNKELSLKVFAERATRYMAILGFPMAIGCIILGDDFIHLFYGNNFHSSVICFQILAFFLPFRWVSGVLGTLLSSINKQGMRVVCVGICAFINIILNFILIPDFSYIGCSIATVLTEFFLYIILKYVADKNVSKLSLINKLYIPFIASILMGLFLFFFKSFNLLILVLMGCFIYFLILYLFGELREEIDLLYKIRL